LFDDTACDWDNEILDSAGICRKNLPVLTAAGSVMGKLDPGIKRRFRLPGAVFVCSGMHDHVATAFLGSEISQGKRYVVNPAGTTESIVHRINDPQKRDRLVTDAPSFGMNTESAWSTAELALVAYPSLSGKIFEAAHRFGVEPSSIFREPDPRICVIPSRRRLVVEDHGMIVPLRPGTVSLEEFWRSYILGTQFEFLKAIHDIELLTESNPYEAVLLFGGQSNSHDICRLKSAVSGIPVIAYPGLNGAALGTASHIARTRGAFTELPLLESSRREYMATEEEIKRFHYQYLRYRENSENARFEEENP
jgi:sugar (pentulose or hexulose) kinase